LNLSSPGSGTSTGDRVMDTSAAAMTPVEEIDLSDFADPLIEGIRLTDAAQGSPSRLLAIQSELWRESERGWCTILLMTDDLAVVRWNDEFALSVTDKGFEIARPLLDIMEGRNE